MRVIYHDLTDRLRHGNTEPVASLDALLAQATSSRSTWPETPATANMIGEAQIRAMKPGAYLSSTTPAARWWTSTRWPGRCATATCGGRRWTCFRSSRRRTRSGSSVPLQGLDNVILTSACRRVDGGGAGADRVGSGAQAGGLLRHRLDGGRGELPAGATGGAHGRHPLHPRPAEPARHAAAPQRGVLSRATSTSRRSSNQTDGEIAATSSWRPTPSTATPSRCSTRSGRSRARSAPACSNERPLRLIRLPDRLRRGPVGTTLPCPPDPLPSRAVNFSAATDVLARGAFTRGAGSANASPWLRCKKFLSSMTAIAPSTGPCRRARRLAMQRHRVARRGEDVLAMMPRPAAVLLHMRRGRTASSAPRPSACASRCTAPPACR